MSPDSAEPSVERHPHRRSLRALDGLNLFLADVRDGIGPYLAIYLLATHHWDAASIGIAMSAAGIAGLIAQAPAGAWIDRSQHKRMIVMVAAGLVAVGCIAMTFFHDLGSIVAAQAVVGVAGAIFPPAVAAITLGMVGHRRLSRQIGRNEGFNHAGNVVAAVFAGLIGHFVAREGIFYLVAAMAIGSIVAMALVDEKDIDHRLARGAVVDAPGEPQPSMFRLLLTDRRIVVFTLALTLFHFANAAMLPLAGQLLASRAETGASLYMSACIIAAQMVMIPVAIWAGRAADVRGRKAVFLVAFAVLPIRGVLYLFGDAPAWIVAVQLLDGVGAGIFGVVWVLVVADLTRGTGRFNVMQGAIATAIGVGASASNIVAGYVVAAGGYDAAFLMLSVVAAVALALFWLGMPETKEGVAVPVRKVPVPA